MSWCYDRCLGCPPSGLDLNDVLFLNARTAISVKLCMIVVFELTHKNCVHDHGYQAYPWNLVSMIMVIKLTHKTLFVWLWLSSLPIKPCLHDCGCWAYPWNLVCLMVVFELTHETLFAWLWFLSLPILATVSDLSFIIRLQWHQTFKSEFFISP